MSLAGTVDELRMIAQKILDSLGDQAPNWSVLEVVAAHPSLGLIAERGAPFSSALELDGAAVVAAGEDDEQEVLITVGNSDLSDTVSAYFALTVPEPEAVVALADQLQDHAVTSGEAFGEPLPPCPGHRHPLVAAVVSGTAVWICPLRAAHHQRPIIG